MGLFEKTGLEASFERSHINRMYTENRLLKEQVQKMREVLSECYGYFSAPNFTDRYGTAERIKKVLYPDENKAPTL